MVVNSTWQFFNRDAFATSYRSSELNRAMHFLTGQFTLWRLDKGELPGHQRVAHLPYYEL